MQDEPPYDYTEAPPEDNVHPLRPSALINRPAEQALLGAILLAPENAPLLAKHVEPGDFYDPKNEQVWNAIYQVLEAGKTPDAVVVNSHLLSSGQLTRIGHTYVVDLVQACPTPRNAPDYADQVREAARLRVVDSLGTQLKTLAATATPETVDLAVARALDQLDQTAARTGPRTVTTQPLYRDLSWLLDGKPPVVEPPAYVLRANGHHIFYPGRVNGIYGDPESAKSWIAQIGIVEALTAGQRATFIDMDHNGETLTTERLLLLGATAEQLADPNQFRYHDPQDGVDLRAALTQLVAWQPHYVVLDSIGEMMPLLGVKSVDNDELSGALRITCSPFARYGACVVTVDHLPKSTEARTSGFAIGGTAKKRAIDGAYIHAEAKTPAAPGSIGRIILRIEKDRPGRLRATCSGKYLGTFILDATDTVITTSIDSDSPITTDGVFRPTHFMERVSRYVEDADRDPSGRDITTAVKGKATHIREAVERLVEEGFLSKIDTTRGHIYHSIANYREADDEQTQ